MVHRCLKRFPPKMGDTQPFEKTLTNSVPAANADVPFAVSNGSHNIEVHLSYMKGPYENKPITFRLDATLQFLSNFSLLNKGIFQDQATIFSNQSSKENTNTWVLTEKLTKYRLALILFALIATVLLSFSSLDGSLSGNKNPATDSSGMPELANFSTGSAVVSTYNDIYAQLGLESIGLDLGAFEQALKGWEKLKAANLLSNATLLSIADFSKPSTQKRLYVIDMIHRKLLYHTYVAHGRNSGKEQAVDFSNSPSSYKSSPGFYRTENTYYGNNGYSLRLEGLEKGINDNAESRAIVMHGANYVNESMIRNMGYLGRSQGCPAIPTKLTRPIINTIKNGSCLFIYAPVTYYAQRSDLIR